MIIIDEVNNNREFKKINVGDCFEFGGEYYMKIPKVKYADKSRMDNIACNAVGLCDGDIHRIADDDVVRVINLESKVVG